MEGLVRSWGPATRKLVGEIELSGNADYIKGERGFWQAFDPKAPLIIDRSESEIRVLLGDEFKRFDRVAKIKETLSNAEAAGNEDPENLEISESYAYKHPVAFSFLSHVGAYVQDAANLNSKNETRQQRWAMGRVRGLDLLGRRMVP